MSNTGLALEMLRPGQRLVVWNSTREILLVRELRLALGPWTRLRGLIGGPPLLRDQGLLLRPCRMVHGCLMRFPIDVVFLDRAVRVVAVEASLRPWGFSSYIAEAFCVLELAAGRAATTGTAPGDRLAFVPEGEALKV